MELSGDIAIIGAGLAAYAAAVELADSGKKILILSKAPGASALSSGSWDLADSPLRTKADEWDSHISIRQNLKEILKREEFHPYSILSGDFLPDDFFVFFQSCMEKMAAPLAMKGSAERNQATVTSLGTVKPTAFVQGSMVDADVLSMENAKVLVVGIQGFPAFNARFISQSLFERQENQRLPHLQFVGSLDVEVPDLPSHASITAVELARHLDQEARFVKFGQAIVRYIQNKVYTHLLLPPVLGMENTAAIVEALRKITGLKVAETLSAPMSVPGWRLWEGMQKYFVDRGITVWEGEAVGFGSDRRRVQSLQVLGDEESCTVNARAFLLATGKFIGGGVRRFQRFEEPIFDLPLFANGRALTDQDLSRLSLPRGESAQPFLSAGVRINPLGQALNEDGALVFENLFAAGSVLAGFDPSHGRCAAGVSLLSGSLAARHILSMI